MVDRQAQLVLKAPFSGQLVDVSPEVILRDWLPAGEKLGTLADTSLPGIVAYLPENQLARVETGMTARFIPDSLEYGVHDLIVENIEFMGTPQLDNLYVASMFGGDVAVRESESGELLTVQSHYRIELQPIDDNFLVERVIRGSVVIDGRAESLFNRIRKRFVAVFIRETGF